MRYSSRRLLCLGPVRIKQPGRIDSFERKPNCGKIEVFLATVFRQTLGICIACSCATSNSSVFASDAASVAHRDGISIEAQRLSDRVSFCIDADAKLKVSSEFGVEFHLVNGDHAAWRQRFPKIVTGPGWYFTLPKRIDLPTRVNPAGQQLLIVLGACSLEANNCNRVELLLTVPQEQKQPIACDE